MRRGHDDEFTHLRLGLFLGLLLGFLLQNGTRLFRQTVGNFQKRYILTAAAGAGASTAGSATGAGSVVAAGASVGLTSSTGAGAAATESDIMGY